MITINDIAKLAKVSKATVSKVINNYPGVKDETKENVLNVMKKHNYWPNSIARSLSTNRSFTIGIFEPIRLNNFFFRDVLEGIEEVLGEEGYDILYFTNKLWEDSWVKFSFKEKCMNRGVDGVLMMGFGNVNLSQFDGLLNSDIPTVFIDLDLVGSNTSYVTSNNTEGAQTAVRYLAGLGHKKIAMIKGPNGFKLANDRFLGYQKTLHEFNLEYNPEWVFSGEYTIETGYKAMLRLLEMDRQPTAIFAEDIFAIGAIKALRDNNLDVPGDYSIIGFDNIELGRHYELTTISQDQIGLGKAASRLLLDIINKKNFVPIILPTKLIERNTCRAL
jgi:LacI family transcriptional regulator/LacI family purine nucleotide synthesis repressor